MNNYHKIKVANIIEEGKIGGPQIRMLAVAATISKKIDTTLIFPKKNSKELQKKSKELNIKYLLFPLTTLRKDWIVIIKYFFSFIFEVVILSKLLKQNKFDILHVSGGSWQYKGVLAAKIAGIKIVWHLNDTYAPFLVRGVFFLLSNLVDSFIFASHKTKKYYKKLIPTNRKFFLIQAPVDQDFFNPKFDYSNQFLKKINFKKKIIIGTVANINPSKDLVTFLKVAKEVSMYKKDIIFLIVGSVFEEQKKYDEYLRNIIKSNKIKNIYFVGSFKDVRPILKILDIYICTSKNESSPISVWEAMSMEKAIVSTDVGDVGKFIKNGVNGYVVKVKDYINLSNKIKKIILNPKLRKTFGRLNRKIVQNKLDLKICAQLHFNAYKTIFKNTI